MCTLVTMWLCQHECPILGVSMYVLVYVIETNWLYVSVVADCSLYGWLFLFLRCLLLNATSPDS